MLDLFRGKVAVLATMHKKEQVISPIVERELGLKVVVPSDLDTDLFGTFTREIKRLGTQLDAAKFKAQKALEISSANIAIASEGSFTAHPYVPFLPCNRELIILIDKEQQLEVVGEELSTQTNYSHQIISSCSEAFAFAEKVGFPEHGLIVMPAASFSKQPIFKGITEKDKLIEAVSLIINSATDGKAHIETDMRAMYNPTRMKNIEKATLDLIQKINQLCPQCSTPGFNLVGTRKGLPCAYCQLPTQLSLSVFYQCQKCNYQQEKFFPDGIEYADPSQCLYCNP